jgi:ribosome maturation factor RimP
LDSLARQVATSLGFQLWGGQLLRQRIPMTLVIQLRRADGGDVSLDDCASCSGPIGDAIEASGLLDQAYVLEISSPGVSDVLQEERDFRSFRGFPVEVHVHDAKTGGELKREGLLLERDETTVHLNVRGRTVRFPRNEVIAVRLTTPTEG